jgi:hypothetical protein
LAGEIQFPEKKKARRHFFSVQALSGFFHQGLDWPGALGEKTTRSNAVEFDPRNLASIKHNRCPPLVSFMWTSHMTRPGFVYQRSPFGIRNGNPASRLCVVFDLTSKLIMAFLFERRSTLASLSQEKGTSAIELSQSGSVAESSTPF